MKSASGKRHPDEAHGPGEETSRPQPGEVELRRYINFTAKYVTLGDRNITCWRTGMLDE